MKKIKYGVLSTAQIARNAHIPGTLSANNSDIIAISSRSREKADHWAKGLNIKKAYGSYEEMLTDKELDAVINALPNSLHCEWTIKAAEAGKHILCEKPLSVTVDEVQRMSDAAEANNVLLMEAFTHRFKPSVKFIKKLVSENTIGNVKAAYATLVYNLQDWQNDVRVNKELSGGCLMDCGCYCISLVRFILGKEPLSVNGFQSIRMPNDVDATFGGMMQFEGDTIVEFFASQELLFKAYLEVFGNNGTIVLDNFFTGTTVKYIEDGKEKSKTFEEKDRFTLQIEHFSDCIINNSKPDFSTQDAKHNTEVLVSLKKAAIEHKAIRL